MERVQSHIIKVLAGLHDERSPLSLVDLHPALTEELPAAQQTLSVTHLSQTDHVKLFKMFICRMLIWSHS